MNIQIFGTKKCNETKKAERYFKERGIKYQLIDMKDKGMSKGEFTAVSNANGGLENQHIIKTLIVRNGKLSTIGYQPDVWKTWT